LCPWHECKQHSYCMQFQDKEDGSKINFLVKSHHYKLFPNYQLLVVVFLNPVFYKVKCENTVIIPISMRFCTFLVLLLREFFYAFLSYGTFFLKVYTLHIFFTFSKNCFSNFKVFMKLNMSTVQNATLFGQSFLQWPKKLNCHSTFMKKLSYSSAEEFARLNNWL